MLSVLNREFDEFRFAFSDRWHFCSLSCLSRGFTSPSLIHVLFRFMATFPEDYVFSLWYFVIFIDNSRIIYIDAIRWFSLKRLIAATLPPSICHDISPAFFCFASPYRWFILYIWFCWIFIFEVYFIVGYSYAADDCTHSFHKGIANATMASYKNAFRYHL